MTATADHRPIWFESSEAKLDPSPEGAAGALLLPAAACGRGLRLASPVSAIWRSNVTRMMGIWREWWNYPILPPQAPELPVTRLRHPGVTLCFTGGVDSFYTLLQIEPRPDALVFVQGYDIPLHDSTRMAAWGAAFGEIANVTGARPVIVRTNLRSHRLLVRCPWERAHGGALAALGHLLAAEMGTLLIASSFPAAYGYRWGSHLDLDPLWSSDRLQVVHHGATHSRVGKLRAIANHELAQRHLRVCWENRAPTGNCSVCDKCLCSMATITACGCHERFRTFDWSSPLADRIQALLATRYVRTYGELLDQGLPAALAVAVRALLQRSPGQWGRI